MDALEKHTTGVFHCRKTLDQPHCKLSCPHCNYLSRDLAMSIARHLQTLDMLRAQLSQKLSLLEREIFIYPRVRVSLSLKIKYFRKLPYSQAPGAHNADCLISGHRVRVQLIFNTRSRPLMCLHFPKTADISK